MYMSSNIATYVSAVLYAYGWYNMCVVCTFIVINVFTHLFAKKPFLLEWEIILLSYYTWQINM